MAVNWLISSDCTIRLICCNAVSFVTSLNGIIETSCGAHTYASFIKGMQNQAEASLFRAVQLELAVGAEATLTHFTVSDKYLATFFTKLR